MTPPLNLPAPGRRQCVYGALRGLARTCVFAKQSLGPIHCGPREPVARGHAPPQASLLPKLRDHYAEFLDHASLDHLRLLASPTCVGFRYGRPTPPPRAFLACRLRSTRVGPKPSPRRPLSVRRPTALDGQSTRPLLLRSRVTRGFNGSRAGRESSPVGHRLRLWGLALGPASPRADRHGAGTLGLPVCGVLTRIGAYSFRHPHFRALHRPSRGGFPAHGTLPYRSVRRLNAKLRRAA